MTLAFNPLRITPPEYAEINGVRTPGLVRFSGVGTQRAWKVTETSGTSGGTIKYEGSRLQRFSMSFELYDDSHWAQWEDLKPILEAEPKKGEDKALSVSHPYLSDAGITAMVVENIGAPEPAEAMLFTVTLKCIQYQAQPKVAASKVAGSPPPAAKKPQTESEKAVDAMTAKVAAAQAAAEAADQAAQAAYLKALHDQGGAI